MKETKSLISGRTLSKLRHNKSDFKHYKISKYRYRELKYFCLQYSEKMEKLKSISYVKASSCFDNLNTGRNNPVEYTTEFILELKKDIKLIEQTALETSGEFYEYILENVTKGMSWEYLDIPISRRGFYYLRRKFFFILSESLHKID